MFGAETWIFFISLCSRSSADDVFSTTCSPSLYFFSSSMQNDIL